MRCTWMRAPSSFHSTDASPTSASAVATSGAPAASIGRTPRPTSSPTPRSPASPSVSATTAVRPRSPDNIAARRTSAAGTDAARATASPMRPASAPWRSSPTSRRRRKSVSAGVARPNTSRRIALATGGRPAPGRHQDLVEGAVDVGDRQRRHRRRRDVEPEHRRPAHADAALAGLAGEEPDRRLDLVGCEPTEQLGERRDLGRARPRRRDRVRRRDDVRQQHGASVPDRGSGLRARSCLEQVRDAVQRRSATPCGRHPRGRSRPTRRSPRRRRARAVARRPTSSSPTTQASAERSSPPMRRMRA